MADTLKDFLISFGFKLDTASQARTESALKRTEEKATAVAETEAAKRVRLKQLEREKIERAQREATKKQDERTKASLKGLEAFSLRASGLALRAFGVIEGAALGVVAAVDQASKGFERLGYASKAAMSSPAKLSSFGYAAAQLGAVREQAEAQLQTFGQKLKTYGSGYERSLNKLGIKTRDERGGLLDTSDIATALGERMRRDAEHGGQFGYANALMRGRMFGFDGDSAQAMMRPGFRGFEEQQRRDAAKLGLDQNAATKSGTAFEQSKRHIEQQIDNIRDKVAADLAAKLLPQLERLSAWIDEHGAHVAEILGRIADIIVRLGTAILKEVAGLPWNSILTSVESMATKFDELAKRITGQDGIKLALEALGVVLGVKVLARLLAIAGALRTVMGIALPPWLLAAIGVPAAAAVAAGAGVAALQSLPEDQKDQILDRHQALQDLRKHKFGGAWNKTKQFFGVDKPTPNDQLWMRGREGQQARRAAEGPWNNGGKAGGRRNANADAVIDEMRKAGYNDNAIAAVIGSMQTESSFNPRAHNNVKGGHTGAWQWDSDRWPRVASWIKAQGGDPFDYRWQAKAWIAEHNAKPGDPIYDNKETESGGAILRASPSLDDAIHGVRLSERFGPGKEGGRGRHASELLPMVQSFGKTPPKPLAVAPPLPGPGVPQGLKGGGYAALGFGADGRPLRPLGDTPALHSSITKGDTNITHNPTFNIHGSGGAGPSMLEAARRTASRGQQDLLRNLQGAVR